MRVIDAFWDTRNLGIPCLEIVFDDDDAELSLPALAQLLDGYSYIAAKVPVDKHRIMQALQEGGFTFVECSINMWHDLISIGNERTEEMSLRMSHELVTDCKDTSYILQRVSDGLFTSDRIYLDPRFTHELASKRYVSWLLDEMQRGACLFDVLFDGEKAGFFSYKEPEEGVSYPFLIGLYPEFRGKGLGASLIVESLLASRQRGCHLSSTYVSSNNIPVIKAHEAIGSRINNMHYVFVKHV